MKLKHVERLSIAGAILVALCGIGIYSGLSPKVTLVLGWVALGLLFVLLILNLRYNRCPKCGSYLWRTGDFCTSCGENLQKYR